MILTSDSDKKTFTQQILDLYKKSMEKSRYELDSSNHEEKIPTPYINCKKIIKKILSITLSLLLICSGLCFAEMMRAVVVYDESLQSANDEDFTLTDNLAFLKIPFVHIPSLKPFSSVLVTNPENGMTAKAVSIPAWGKASPSSKLHFTEDFRFFIGTDEDDCVLDVEYLGEHNEREFKHHIKRMTANELSGGF